MTQSEEIVYNHSHYNMQSWSKQANLNPIPVAKAEGIYVYDFEGNCYSDMSAQLVNLNVGHGCGRTPPLSPGAGHSGLRQVL